MDEIILKKIYEQLKIGNNVAFATITEVKGSSPGKQGATMALLSDNSIIGTVGGGMVEHLIIKKCEESLLNKQDATFEYGLGEEIGMQCGGNIKGYIKVFKAKPKLIIIGGGHVGLALFKLAKILDFYTIVIDDREEFANKERFDGVDEVYFGDIKNNIDNININENTNIVIATKGYETDLASLDAVIKKEANYIGMIGSKRKCIEIRNKLMQKGITKEELDRVYAPIGINISSDKVEEIAFGILAEVLLVKNNGKLVHRKDTKK